MKGKEKTQLQVFNHRQMNNRINNIINNDNYSSNTTTTITTKTSTTKNKYLYRGSTPQALTYSCFK